MQKNKKKMLFGLFSLFIVGTIFLFLPPVWSRITYHVRQIYIDFFYKLNPPEEDIFIPAQSTPDKTYTAGQAIDQAFFPTSTPTLQTTLALTKTPAPTQMPLPSSFLLDGYRKEGQIWSNCGPATLSMNLSHWNWKGDQEDIAASLRPNERDKNTMPYEIVDYVNENTDLIALSRMGGDLYTLKALVSAGIPVLIEKGYEPLNRANEELGWMGHYNLVIGYDDAAQIFYTLDSYKLALLDYEDRQSAPNSEVPYPDMSHYWRAFNNVFIVVYSADNTNDVLNALGQLADETTSYQLAHERALADTNSYKDSYNLFFSWYNVGTSLVKLQDFSGAATAYDKAFSFLESIPEKNRPYRMLWYQTGPYYAYFYSGRYQDVVNLSTTTINAEAEHVLEESYHWRALAEIQMGYYDGAVADLRQALKVHPGFTPSYDYLISLGETP